MNSPQGAIAFSGLMSRPRLRRGYARAMPRTARLIASAVAAAALLTACSEGPEEVIDIGASITTAEDALECPEDAKVEARSVSVGSRRGQGDAGTALQAWADKVRRTADIPIDGYQVAVEEVGTVLFTHETDRRAEIAVIAERTEDTKGDLGWLVTSWARCRP